jgi:hypothetical protein
VLCCLSMEIKLCTVVVVTAHHHCL